MVARTRSTDIPMPTVRNVEDGGWQALWAKEYRGGPSFREVSKGWESFLLAHEILALGSSPICLDLVGATFH